jgi:predicted porin
MKKSLLALAVLGAYAGVASAQSSVTLYGTLDANGRYVKADGQSKRYSMGTDGINSSQLGFRGVEDLGGGLRAGFTLLAGVNPDAGTSNTATTATGATQSKFWNRRSTVSLFGGWGELRMGRDYTPTFWNQTIFDAFGTNGLGSSLNPRQLYGGTRQDNSIGYFLPANLGGFYGQVMASANEGATTLDRPGRYVGGRVGFAAGPFDVAFSASQLRFGTAFAANTVAAGAVLAGTISSIAGAEDEQETWNVGGSWDFGFFKLLGYYNEDKLRSAKEKMASVSGVIPFGQAEVHLGYDLSKYSNGSVGTKVEQLKGTFQYNLSKRTAVYTTASLLDNKDGTRYTLPGAAGLTTASGKSQGIEFGVRHFF